MIVALEVGEHVLSSFHRAFTMRLSFRYQYCNTSQMAGEEVGTMKPMPRLRLESAWQNEKIKKMNGTPAGRQRGNGAQEPGSVSGTSLSVPFTRETETNLDNFGREQHR